MMETKPDLAAGSALTTSMHGSITLTEYQEPNPDHRSYPLQGNTSSENSDECHAPFSGGAERSAQMPVSKG